MPMDPVLGARVIALVPPKTHRNRPLALVVVDSDRRLEATCREWNEVVQARGFLVCLADGAEPQEPSADSLPRAAIKRTEERLRSVMTELKTRFAGRVARDGLVMVGIGDAASRLVHVIGTDPSFFQYVILVDGGFAAWTAARSGAFAERGGTAALALCGAPDCLPMAVRMVSTLRATGVEARVVAPDPETNGPGSLTPGQVAEAWNWLVNRDSRWTPVSDRVTTNGQ